MNVPIFAALVAVGEGEGTRKREEGNEEGRWGGWVELTVVREAKAREGKRKEEKEREKKSYESRSMTE